MSSTVCSFIETKKKGGKIYNGKSKDQPIWHKKGYYPSWKRVRGSSNQRSSKRMKRQGKRDRERERKGRVKRNKKSRVVRKEDRRRKNTGRSSHRCTGGARELKK